MTVRCSQAVASPSHSIGFGKNSARHQRPLHSPLSLEGNAAEEVHRTVSVLVTQRLIYPVHAMLPRDKLINQVCISNATP